MKIVAAIVFAILSVSATAVDYTHASVVHDVLSAESITMLNERVSATHPDRELRGGNTKIHGKVSVQAEIIHSIRQTIGKDRELTQEDALNLPSTILKGSSMPHVDSKMSGDEYEEDEKTMFLNLNTVEGGFFVVGEDKIPIIENTMIIFDGHLLEHNTVAPDGSEIRLLGPFASRNLSTAVGVASPSPTPNPNISTNAPTPRCRCDYD